MCERKEKEGVSCDFGNQEIFVSEVSKTEMHHGIVWVPVGENKRE